MGLRERAQMLRPRLGEPTLATVFRDALAAAFREVHTCLPGVVHTYDKTIQTANIQPAVKGVLFDADDAQIQEILPIIPNVPVVWLRGAGASLQGKLAKGDHCVLCFSESATAIWRKTGQISEPGDLRRMDLSYAFALPGIAPDSGKLDPVGDDESWVLDGPGFIRVGGPSADFVALAQKVDAEIQRIWDLLTGWTVVPNDGGLALQTQALTDVHDVQSVAASKLKGE